MVDFSRIFWFVNGDSTLEEISVWRGKNASFLAGSFSEEAGEKAAEIAQRFRGVVRRTEAENGLSFWYRQLCELRVACGPT